MNETPFHTSYNPRWFGEMPLARRPILARALRADVLTPAMGPVFVWGEPFIGKTTLVRQVLWSLEPDQHLVARVPFGALAAPVRTKTRFAGIVSRQVSLQLEPNSPWAVKLDQCQSVVEALETCLEAASSTSRSFVLAIEGIDRYVASIWPPLVLENYQTVLSYVPNLAVLLTSRLPGQRLEHLHLTEDFRVHFVPPLDKDAARHLLIRPLKDTIPLETDTVERFLDETGLRPLLIQIIGRNCHQLAHSRGDTRLLSRDANEIIESCWLGGEALFRTLIGNLLPNCQYTLLAVALANQNQIAAASFERIFSLAHRINSGFSLANLANELSTLHVLRLVDDNGANGHKLTMGWLGRYLLADY